MNLDGQMSFAGQLARSLRAFKRTMMGTWNGKEDKTLVPIQSKNKIKKGH